MPVDAKGKKYFLMFCLRWPAVSCPTIKKCLRRVNRRLFCLETWNFFAYSLPPTKTVTEAKHPVTFCYPACYLINYRLSEPTAAPTPQTPVTPAPTPTLATPSTPLPMPEAAQPASPIPAPTGPSLPLTDISGRSDSADIESIVPCRIPPGVYRQQPNRALGN